MKNLKLIATAFLTISALAGCSNNASLADDLNATSVSVAEYVNGTFSAEIYNTSIQSVYNATKLALDNNDIYSIKNSDIDDQKAEIIGTYATEKTFFNESGTYDFKVNLIKKEGSTVGIFIKIGKLGDKQASVNLLADIRDNLGL